MSTTPKPISIQLYTVREQAKDGNHIRVLQEIADIGYKGVEGFGYGMSPRDFRHTVEDMGMVVSSYFGPFPDPDKIQEFIETAKGLGVTQTVTGLWVEDFASKDAICRTADRLRPAIDTLRENGLNLCLHNHWMEFELIEGRLAIEHLIDLLPDLNLEIDIYWCSAFGANNPSEVVRRYRDRTPLLHVKDGPLTKGQPHQALGQGRMNLIETINMVNPDKLEWLVVELDECATDMMTAVKESYQYLIDRALGLGNR